MYRPTPEWPKSVLLIKTLQLLRNRPKELSMPVIAEATGLTVGWLNSILNEGRVPTVERCEYLYTFLSGKRLEL